MIRVVTSGVFPLSEDELAAPSVDRSNGGGPDSRRDALIASLRCFASCGSPGGGALVDVSKAWTLRVSDNMTAYRV